MLPFSLPSFDIQEVSSTSELITITACATSSHATCPTSHQISRRVHSCYSRSPKDLPVSGRNVRLRLSVHRFRCQNPLCHRQTFVENLPDVVARSARHTKRFHMILHTVTSALSGQVGSRLLTHMGMNISGDTLLRIAKRRNETLVKMPEMLDVDDFAFK